MKLFLSSGHVPIYLQASSGFDGCVKTLGPVSLKDENSYMLAQREKYVLSSVYLSSQLCKTARALQISTNEVRRRSGMTIYMTGSPEIICYHSKMMK